MRSYADVKSVNTTLAHSEWNFVHPTTAFYSILLYEIRYDSDATRKKGFSTNNVIVSAR